MSVERAVPQASSQATSPTPVASHARPTGGALGGSGFRFDWPDGTHVSIQLSAAPALDTIEELIDYLTVFQKKLRRQSGHVPPHRDGAQRIEAMNYTEKLQEWFASEKAAGRLVDLKFFPGVGATGQDGSVEKFAQAAYETLTGICATEALDTTAPKPREPGEDEPEQ